MSRWRLRLLVLATGAALSAASVPTLSAWTASTSNPAGTVSAIPDWVAPDVESMAVIKEEGGKAGYVRPTGSYHVCSKIGADSGNPASGLNQVLTDVSALTANLVNQILNPRGGGSPCAATDDRDSGLLTAATTAGTKTVSLLVRDNANNTRTATTSVTVDGTTPSAVEFETTNKAGGTQGRPETGDTVIFRFSEPIDPHSIVTGWDGTAPQTVIAYMVQASANDRLSIYRQVGASYPQVPVTAVGGTNNYVSLGRDYVNSNVAFTGSSMTVSGNDVIVTLGTPDQPTQIRPANLGTTATVWRKSATLFDYAGNVMPAGFPLTESGGADTEF